MRKTIIEKPIYESFETPILIICFNRPQYVNEQLGALRLIKPKNVYIACDGPRTGNRTDDAKVIEVRENYLTGIDWQCDIKTNYSPRNQGCFLGPKNALTWFFSEVEAGIILEDDIIPNKDFFDFMKVMLAHFESDKVVISISGCTLGYGLPINTVYSSKIMNMWGWATWSDRYNKIDFSLNSWKNKKNKKWFLHTRLNESLFDFDWTWINHWKNIFDKTISTEIVTWWDYQFIYNQLESNKKTVYPSKNLVRNIGFDSDATHTTSQEHLSRNLETNPLNWPIEIPHKLKEDQLFYNTYIKEKWSYYKRRNWKYFVGKLLGK